MSSIWPVVIPTVIVGLVVARQWRPTRPAELGEWAAAHALALTDTNRPFVRHYLTTGRRLRGVCVLGAVVLPSLVEIALDAEAKVEVSVAAVLVGYLLGTLWAELTLTRPPTGTARAAVLSPRHLADYLPGRLRLALRIVGPVTAAAWLLTRLLPYRQEYLATRGTLTAAWLAAAAALAVPILVEAAQRWILRRPQPLVAPDLLAADDAVRASSLHFLGGAGVAIVLLSLSGACWEFSLSDSPIRSFGWVGGTAAVFAAMIAWQYYCHRAWRVQRGVPSLGPPVGA